MEECNCIKVKPVDEQRWENGFWGKEQHLSALVKLLLMQQSSDFSSDQLSGGLAGER